MSNAPNFSNLIAVVEAEETVIESAVTLIDGFVAELQGLTPSQDAINALIAKVQGDKDKLAAAVQANT